jgi:enoyl-CoA hydratase/carnithine racemase
VRHASAAAAKKLRSGFVKTEQRACELQQPPLTVVRPSVGPAKAAELLFTGDGIDAGEALRTGLVSYPVPLAELAARAVDLAGRIVANPSLALRCMKDGLRRFAGSDPNEAGAWAIQTIRRLMETADHRAGAVSFLEKRPPVFQSR